MTHLKRFVLLASLLLPTAVHAGGYHFPDLGAVALARGGAFVAKADSPLALYYNPAGAARMRGTQILLSLNMMFEDTRFQRRYFGVPGQPADPNLNVNNYPHANDVRMPEIRTSTQAFPNPSLFLTTDLGGLLSSWNLMILAGVYGPNAPRKRKFPRYCKEESTDVCLPSDVPTSKPSPGRYESIGTDILVVYPSLGLAWQPIRGLSIGAVAQLGYAQFSYDTVVASVVTENPLGDVDVNVNVKSDIAVTGIFGAHWQALKWLEFGASVRLGLTFAGEGEVTSNVPDTVGQLIFPFTIDPNPAPAKLKIPKATIVRTGARYVYHDNADRELFDIEFDFWWENTSVLKEFFIDMEVIIRNETGTELLRFGDVALPHQWRDTYSLRLGGSYHIYDLIKNSRLSARAGVFYEPSAVPKQYTRLDFLPLERVGVTVGLGFQWERWQLNIAYAHIFHKTRFVQPANQQSPCKSDPPENDTCGSAVKVLVPLEKIAGDGLGNATGNGRFKSAIDQLTISAKVDI